MNYYERHLGDYARDTAHLTLLEHGAYTLLLDRCYATEQGIPADQAHRIARARSREEKQAVDAVLAEFFVLTDGVWTNRRVLAEIARFNEGEPEREIKKANEANRLKRYRDERARLFKVLTDAGEHAAWNVSMNDLRALVQRIETGAKPLPETPPATAPATPVTATSPQTPDTSIRIPPYPPKGVGRRFEEFWLAWPKGERKQDKAKCEAKWRRSELDELADMILADIRVKRGTEKWREGFIEAPLVYLNGRRWEDGVEANAGRSKADELIAGAI